MKHTKIILFISATILSMAGVAAIKVRNFGTSPGYFWTYQRLHTAYLPTSHYAKSTIGATAVTTLTVPSSNPIQVYKTIIYTNAVCTHIMHYQVL